MNRLAVENKLARIHWNATLALDLIQYGFKDQDLQAMRRYLNNILAASPSQATRNLNHIPDPIDQPDPASDADMDRGCREPDWDAMGNEALMNEDEPTTGVPDPDCPF